MFFFSFWKNKINKSFNLVELGPGRGTLLIDILNITKNFSEFKRLITINLIEKNSELIKQQKNNLVKFKFNFLNINWFDTFNPLTTNLLLFMLMNFLTVYQLGNFIKKIIYGMKRWLFLIKQINVCNSKIL